MANSDTHEDIQQCLNCKHSRCIDCLSRYHRTHRSPKTKVAQIDINTGEIIATYDSLTHAQMVTGINRSGISKCLRGVRSNAGGYQWKETNAHV